MPSVRDANREGLREFYVCFVWRKMADLPCGV